MEEYDDLKTLFTGFLGDGEKGDSTPDPDLGEDVEKDWED